MVSIKQIKITLGSIDVIDGDTSTEHLDKAVAELEMASEALNTISVRGRDNLDKLLGCMLGIDMILGKKESDS